MKAAVFAFLTIAFCVAACFAGNQSIEARMEEDRIVVEIEGKVFTEYLFSEEHKYPFFYPVVGPESGESVTTWDQEPFPHHSSLYISLDHVRSDGVRRGNYWQPRHNLNTGQVFSRNPRIVESEGDRVVLADDTDWIVAQANAHQLREKREVTIWAPSPKVRILDFRIELEPLKDLVVRQTGHSFFSARMDSRLAVGCNQRGAQWADIGTGTILNAEGERNENGTRAKASNWCVYFGTRDGIVEGLAIIQHSSNSLYPGRWFNRDYGFMSPTPFAFDGNIELPANEKLEFRYRVVVFSGEPSAVDIAGWHRDFDPVESD